jgi:hypothetical protein
MEWYNNLIVSIICKTQSQVNVAGHDLHYTPIPPLQPKTLKHHPNLIIIDKNKFYEKK